MRAARVDANQPIIVEALRAFGASVQPLQTVGKGCPDLLVGISGINLAMEVKDGSRPPSERQLTPDQQVWHREWKGSVSIVTDVESALRAARMMVQLAEALRRG